jgi:pyruvate,water dikinase
MAILKSIDLDQYLRRELPEKLKAAKRRQAFRLTRMLVPALLAYLRPKSFIQRYLQALPHQVQRIEHAARGEGSLKRLASDLTGLLSFFFLDYGLPVVLAPQIAQLRLRRMFRTDAAGLGDELASLGMALPGNKTAEMGEQMYWLAASDEINSLTSEDEFIARLEEGSLDSGFLQSWDSFIQEYGARCPREIDVATARPHEQPRALLERLRAMSSAIDARHGATTVFEQARAKRESAHGVLRTVARRRGRRAGRAFDRYYEVLTAIGGYRETGKHYVVMVVDLFRKRVLRVADTFVAEGRLDTRDQVFGLTIDDIDRARADPSLDLRTLFGERTRLIDRFRGRHRVARVIDSRGRIYEPPRTADSAGELAGVSISPGVARGRARVLHHPAEQALLPGEILVARATDPGWTPLFIGAKAIVLEIGGALQHGAVVAREYGLPCVSGVVGATDILKDGQMIEVDGSHGVVRVLEEDTSSQ